jgi:hypothetical protein
MPTTMRYWPGPRGDRPVGHAYSSTSASCSPSQPSDTSTSDSYSPSSPSLSTRTTAIGGKLGWKAVSGSVVDGKGKASKRLPGMGCAVRHRAIQTGVDSTKDSHKPSVTHSGIASGGDAGFRGSGYSAVRQGKVNKPHRYRPGMIALREIRRPTKSGELRSEKMYWALRRCILLRTLQRDGMETTLCLHPLSQSSVR